MAQIVKHKDTTFSVGDTISVSYKVKEGEKERTQLFQGILIKIRGATPSMRMITIRKSTRSGIGVERILPLSSPHIADIKVNKKGTSRRSKLYFLRDLSEKKLSHKLYHKK